MASANPGIKGDSDILSLRDIWRIVVKRRRQAALVASVVIALAVLYTLLATPLYTASATVQIDTTALRIVTSATLEVADPSGDFIATQTEMLRSRTVALRAVRDLALVADPVFQKVSHQPRGWRSVLELFRKDRNPAVDERTLEEQERAAVGIVQNGLSVETVNRTRVVRLKFVSADPVLAQRIVNGVATAFMQANLDRRVDNMQFARRFLEDRLQQTKLKLEDSERAMIAYAEQQSIANLDDSMELVRKSQESLNSELAKVQSERIKAEAQLQQFDSKAGVSIDALNSPVLETLRQKLVDMQAEYQAKRSQYKVDYPEMLQLATRIREVQSQMDSESRAFQRATEGAARAARANESLLLRQIGRVQSTLLGLQARSIKYNILKREADTNRQLYDGLLQRYKEIGVEGSSDANNISLVDPAERGVLSQPKAVLNLILGVLLGAGLGVGVVLVLELIDDTVKTPEDIEKQLRLPVLGLVPRVPADEFDDALAMPRSSLAEAYRSLRTSLQYVLESGAPRVLVVTSSAPSEGKSTSSQVLALQCAQMGQRVLLVDADLRKPSLHTRFGVGNDTGLSSLLSAEANLEEITLHRFEGLTLITSGPTPSNPALLLSSQRFRSFIEQASADYDQVIIDCPPLLGLADVPAIVGLADGVMMVVGAGSTRVGAVRASIKRLLAARAKLLGILLVKFDASAVAYGYGYEYADHQYYGASYGAYGDGRRLPEGRRT